MSMREKRTTVHLTEPLDQDLADFCRQMRAVQGGVIEAAIYWVVHRMNCEDYVQLMREVTAYLDGQPTPEEGAGMEDFHPKTEFGRKLKAKGGLGRGREKGAAG